MREVLAGAEQRGAEDDVWSTSPPDDLIAIEVVLGFLARSSQLQSCYLPFQRIATHRYLSAAYRRTNSQPGWAHDTLASPHPSTRRFSYGLIG